MLSPKEEILSVVSFMTVLQGRKLQNSLSVNEIYIVQKVKSTVKFIRLYVEIFTTFIFYAKNFTLIYI